MSDWVLEIAFHWPHDRFALGWDTIAPTEEEPFSTLRVYLLFVTLNYLLKSVIKWATKNWVVRNYSTR
jgi:hypothetical protein